MMKHLGLICLFCLFPLFSLSAQEKIRVACVGNSVTYGTGIANRAVDSYPAQLQRMLGNTYEVRNFGRPCATLLKKGPLPYDQVKEFHQALAFKADRVIIHLGLNDTDPDCWPNYADEFITDYRALIDSFRVANPQAKIWVCRMTPIFHRHKRFQSSTRDWHTEIQEKILQVARTYNVGLIDFYEPLHSRIELFPDALHPNPEGAGILAQKVYGALTGDFGGLQLPPYLGDGMVLQREQPLVFSGKANAGEEVTIRFRHQQRTTQAGGDGSWKISWPALPAGGPYTMEISTSTRTLNLKEIWLGEVWLCSGQSNMVFPLKKCDTAKEDLSQADQASRLHFFHMKQLIRPAYRPWDPDILDSVNHLHYLQQGHWTACNAKDAAEFSAIAYHFGKILADSLQCPVGLVCNPAGALPAESWIDRTTLEKDLPAILYDWKNNDHTSRACRELAKTNTKRASNPLQRHPAEPAYLFECAIQPLKDLNIRGVIWYQGEANTHNAGLHERLFPLLQKSWRNFWHNDTLPFYTVQLSSLSTQKSWPRFRDSQRRLALNDLNTWMTVSSDLGDSLNIHPAAKRPIAQRLALSALYHTYQHTALVPSGPELAKAVYDGKEVRLTFHYGKGLHPAKGPALIGFEIAGDDGIYFPAQAKITPEGLTLTSPQVSQPKAVRYGWQPFTHANLVNGAELPCSTFCDAAFTR